MDARDRLRRYLEQRRDSGESELVLDGMPVEDVMALLDGSKRPLRSTPRRAAPASPADASRADASRADASPADASPADASPADASPDAVGAMDTAQQGAMAPSERDAPGSDPTPPEPASAHPTPALPPEVRFDADASTDWRETLRRAGAMKPSPEGGRNARDEQPPLMPGLVPADAAPGRSAASTQAPAWLTALDIPLGIAAGDITTRVIEPAIAALPTLDAIADATRACTRCELYRTATQAVPGEGNPNADFVCVGEAPGQNEDEQGRPFIGAAGQLLNKILAAINLRRDDVFICNVLKHRPPGNRDPLPEEVRACEPYLRRQLELLQPRVILALGRFAAQSLLQTTTPIGKLRGQVHRYHGIPLIVTYHPAALLRNEAWKRPTWEDVKLARRILDASRAAAGASSGPLDTPGSPGQ